MAEAAISAGMGGGGARSSRSSLLALVAWLGAAERPHQAGAEEHQSADAADIRRSLNGDSDAYRRLVERHQAAVAKIMWRFTRDRGEHEELTHRVFVEAYLSLATYSARAPFEHWLARIATRVGYRYWKEQEKERRPVALSDALLNRLGTDDGRDQREAADLVHHLLERLPARDRLVLTLRYLEQCDVKETARRIGWSRVHVRVQTHRALKKLRQVAAEAEIELEL